MNAFERDLQERKAGGLFRSLVRPSSGADFVSNDFLGLSSHPEIRAALIQALRDDLPLSGRASRLLSGSSARHEEMEERLSGFVGKGRGLAALIFPSGWQANVGVLAALSRGRTVFSDRLNHASLIDGIALSKSRLEIYPHKDLNVLEALLKKTQGEKLIVTESLFSMDGDFAPLEEILDLALKHGALLFADEAHATGLFGPCFGGFAGALKEPEAVVSMHSFGKALGSCGAFIRCSRLIKDWLVNHCRSFIYTTAPPPLRMVQWAAALDVLGKETFRPLTLRKKALQFRKVLREQGLFPSLELTESPIIPLVISSAEQRPALRGRAPLRTEFQRTASRRTGAALQESGGDSQGKELLRDGDRRLRLTALEAAEALQKKGFDVRAVRYPAVPKGTDRIRLVLKFHHSESLLTDLQQALKDLL